MSNKQLLSVFAEKMATDEQFVMKVAAIQTKENLVALAATMGYELTLEQAEMGLERIKKLSEKPESLEDDDVEGVAGGYSAKAACGCFSGYNCCL